MTCSPPTAQTTPKFNGVFVWSQKTCSKANVRSSSPCSQHSSFRGWHCSSLFLELFLLLFQTGCSLNGPCRCPELAQPLQVPGSRLINKMLSFEQQSWERRKRRAHVGRSHMDPIAALIMLGWGERPEGLLPGQLPPWFLCLQAAPCKQRCPGLASSSVCSLVLGERSGRRGRQR